MYTMSWNWIKKYINERILCSCPSPTDHTLSTPSSNSWRDSGDGEHKPEQGDSKKDLRAKSQINDISYLKLTESQVMSTGRPSKKSLLTTAFEGFHTFIIRVPRRIDQWWSHGNQGTGGSPAKPNCAHLIQPVVDCPREHLDGCVFARLRDYGVECAGGKAVDARFGRRQNGVDGADAGTVGGEGQYPNIREIARK